MNADDIARLIREKASMEFKRIDLSMFDENFRCEIWTKLGDSYYDSSRKVNYKLFLKASDAYLQVPNGEEVVAEKLLEFNGYELESLFNELNRKLDDNKKDKIRKKIIKSNIERGNAIRAGKYIRKGDLTDDEILELADVCIKDGAAETAIKLYELTGKKITNDELNKIGNEHFKNGKLDAALEVYKLSRNKDGLIKVIETILSESNSALKALDTLDSNVENILEPSQLGELYLKIADDLYSRGVVYPVALENARDCFKRSDNRKRLQELLDKSVSKITESNRYLNLATQLSEDLGKEDITKFLKQFSKD